MEETNNEISLMELWERIWKNKFIITLITLALVIIGFVFVFISNRSKSIVQTQFNYSFITNEDNTYLNGIRFDYRNTFTVEHLESVKSSNNDFKDIDTTKIANDKNANISKQIIENSREEVTNTYYEIKIPIKHFNNNEELAEKFIKAFHENVLDLAKEHNKHLLMHNYFDPNEGTSLSSSERYAELTYLEILELIKSQLATVTSTYNKYGSIVLSTGLRLEDMYLEFQRWLSQDLRMNLLEAEIKNNFYYINLDRTVEIATLSNDKVTTDIRVQNEMLQDLKDLYIELYGNSSFLGDSDLAKQIATKVEQIALLEEQSKYNKHFTTTTNITEPTDNLELKEEFFTLVDELKAYVDNFNSYYLDYLNQITNYTVNGDVEFVIVPKYNLMLMVVVFALIGGIIGVTTALIKESITSIEKLETTTA